MSTLCSSLSLKPISTVIWQRTVIQERNTTTKNLPLITFKMRQHDHKSMAQNLYQLKVSNKASSSKKPIPSMSKESTSNSIKRKNNKKPNKNIKNSKSAAYG
jgi:hypothetical protein